MNEIKNYQVPLNEGTMEELIKKTHATTQKGALTAAIDITMGKYIPIDAELESMLDKVARKDENGQREEDYGSQIKRLIKRA